METCRQARTHLRGVVRGTHSCSVNWSSLLTYIRRTPLPPRDWTELNTLLTRRFQPRDLTAAYKARFRARKRQKSKDIPTYIDALQKLAEMASPLLDPIARGEMVTDQFLNGLDSHELRAQVAATGIRRIEDLMRVARSLEAVENQKVGHGRQRRGKTQARFSDEEESKTEAMWIVDQILAQLGPELRQGRDPKKRPPTPGPQHIRSVERETSPALQRNPLRIKVPRRQEIEIGDARQLQIRSDQETEKGLPNVTS